MLIYLAGAINGTSDSLARDWRRYVTDRLALHGHSVLDPMRRDFRGLETGHVNEIVHGDLADIRECDAVIANCAHGPSWGTAMEIFFAHSIRRPVYAAIGFKPQISPWLVYHATRMYCTVGECVDILATR